MDGRYPAATLPFHAAETSGQLRWFDTVERRDARTIERLDAAISSFTDADLGALSGESQTVQARQQLALQTINPAISAYGSFASGVCWHDPRLNDQPGGCLTTSGRPWR